MDYSPEDRGFGLTQLASRDSEKANELRKKLEARQALNAAAAAAQTEGGGRSRKRDSAGGGVGASKENGYAKVEGPKVSRIIQTVCLTLGREGMSSKRKAPEPADEELSVEEAQREKRRDKTFLSIGQDTSISRRHVEIVYDFHKRRWALICLGRNGVYLDDVFIQQGDAPAALRNKSKIQVPNAAALLFTCPAEQAGAPAARALQRPSESLKVLIAQAMAERQDRTMMVGEIYQRIKDKHAFYRNQPEASWQSSIRHCLTINKCFVKVPKQLLDAAHKGASWTMLPEADPALSQLIHQPRPPPPHTPAPAPAHAPAPAVAAVPTAIAPAAGSHPLLTAWALTQAGGGLSLGAASAGAGGPSAGAGGAEAGRQAHTNTLHSDAVAAALRAQGAGAFGLLQGGHGMQQALEMARSMAGLAGAPGMPNLGLRASVPLPALHTMVPSQLELLYQQGGGQGSGFAGVRGANQGGDKEEEVFRGARGDEEATQDKDDSNEGSDEQELEGEEGEGDSDDAGMVIDDE